MAGGAAVALLGAAVGYGVANRPAPPPPLPVQPPTLTTTVHYLGVEGPADYGESSFTVHMEISNADGAAPVTVTAISQGYAGISTITAPPTPYTLQSGASHPFDMIATVRDCAKTPIAAGMPLVNVTLRNTRAIRTRSEIFGDAYARSLSAVLRSLCPSAAKEITQLSPH